MEEVSTGQEGQVNEVQADNSEIENPTEGMTAAEIRKYKVLVDQEEIEVDEDELRRGYSHARSAGKRMQEAAAVRNEARAIIQMLQQDPAAVFEKLGIDPDNWANSHLAKKLEEMTMSPEERERRQMKSQLERYQRQEQEERTRYEQERLQQQLDEQTSQIQQQLIEAVEGSGLPPNNRTLARIVHYMQIANKKGYHDITPKDVLPMVREDYRRDYQELAGNIEGAQLEEFFGKDLVKKIAKSTVQQDPRMRGSVPKEINRDIKPMDRKKVKSPKDFFGR